MRTFDRSLNSSDRPYARLAASIFFIAFFGCLFFPMMTDEAYDMDWARRVEFPSFGFFDHPPMVSWQAFLVRFWHSLTFARFGALFAAIAGFYVNWRTAFLLTQNRASAWTAACVAHTTLGGIANSILLTPDSGLALCWSVALHEGVYALTKNPHRWLSAGVATGVGLLSKYTMLLIGPVFLLGLILENRKQLKTPWPYLGGILALLVFLPNILWNKNNNWETFRFQFRHGFYDTQKKSEIQSSNRTVYPGTRLPLAEGSYLGSSTMTLYQNLKNAMDAVPGFDETYRKEHRIKSRLEYAWQYIGDYLGGVLALWGGFILWWVIQRKSITLAARNNWMICTRTPGFKFIVCGFAVPLAFFFLLSPFAKVEANWPAMHIPAFAIFATMVWKHSFRMLVSIFSFHTVILLILILISMFPSFLPFGRDNRLANESNGYDKLVELITPQINGVLVVDSYQLKSMFAYLSPKIKTVQWPGITRASEYTRGAPEDLARENELLSQRQFYLVTFENIPPELPGYNATSLEGIRSCPDGTIGKYSTRHTVIPCEKGLRDWWLVSYQSVLD